MRCAFCGAQVELDVYLIHLNTCMLYLIDEASSSGESAGDEDASMHFMSMMVMSIQEGNTSEYEMNLALADSIGVVEIGVKDIDACAPPHPMREGEEASACPICLEEMDATHRRRTLCGHDFCGGCIAHWLSKHKSCPCCKADVQVLAEALKVRVPPILRRARKPRLSTQT